MRDALLAGLTFDIFNRNAEKVVMGNVAQLTNCLQSLFLTDGDKFTLTPTFHVFEMFMPHMGAQAVRAEFSAPKIKYDRNGKDAEFLGLAGCLDQGQASDANGDKPAFKRSGRDRGKIARR